MLLLGEQGGTDSPEALEFKRLLGSLGMTSFDFFPGPASLGNMSQMPAASFSLVVGGADRSAVGLQKLGKLLETEYHIPFFNGGFPGGVAGTRRWLESLGEFLGRPELSRSAGEDLNERLKDVLPGIEAALAGLKTVLCIGRPREFFNPEWVLELFSLTKARLSGIVLLETLTGPQREVMEQELAQLTLTPLLCGVEGTRLLEEADLVLTTHELQDSISRQLFLPLLTPIGVSGILTLTEKLTRIVRRKGGAAYV